MGGEMKHIETAGARSENDGEASSRDLVERCRRRDERAFGELYERYADRIHRHLLVLLGRPSDADDALQVVFMKAFRSIDTFEGRSTLSTWMHGIAVHVALTQLRMRKRRESAMHAFAAEKHGAGSGAAHGDAEVRVVLAQRVERLHRHLEKVSPKRRVPFLLYYVEQLELSEVAAQIGTSEPTAWARIKRTRARVLRAIEREDLGERRREGETP